MNSMICKPTESSVYLPSIKELCIFLSDYAAGLLGCGATCIRIEKNITRISLFFGYDSEMTIMPSHIHLTIWNKEHTDSYSIIRRMHKTGISFDMNTKLSKLSWEIADGKISFQEATLLAERIYHTSSVNPRVVLFLASCANASFCRLFGGDFISMGVVFIATLVGYYIKQMIGAGGHIFGWGTTPEIALGTSVLYLIPGIPYINSVSDMLDGHYICAFSRFMNAIVLTACLSAGLCGGLFLMGLDCF